MLSDLSAVALKCRELLFPESAGTKKGGLEPYDDAVAELSEDLRRIVQRAAESLGLIADPVPSSPDCCLQAAP